MSVTLNLNLDAVTVATSQPASQPVVTVVLLNIFTSVVSRAMSPSQLAVSEVQMKLSRLVVVLVVIVITTVLDDIYQFRDHGAGWL